MGMSNLAFFFDKEGFLVPSLPTDGAIQIFVPMKLIERMLLISHYQTLEGNPVSRKLYDTMRRSFLLSTHGK